MIVLLISSCSKFDTDLKDNYCGEKISVKTPLKGEDVVQQV